MRRPSRAIFLLTLLSLCWLPNALHAQGLPGEGEGWSFPTNLNSWTFGDTNTWHSDLDYAPISFTNLASSLMGNIGNGFSLVLDHAEPAWLHFHTQEADGTNNLTIETGSLTFWFAPNWASATTNQNGAGPGDWGRLIEVGAYTTNASYGWWSLLVDEGGTNLYFMSQTNSGDGVTVTHLSAPIDWATNEWHNVTLTYSPTNTALYLDGELAASGGGLTVFPGPEVVTNGFWIGSDSNGLAQARGLFDDLYTYDFPLDGETAGLIYQYLVGYYLINIFNAPMPVEGAPFEPSATPVFRAVTGAGWLQWVGGASGCVTSDDVWLTNTTSVLTGSGTNITATATFTIGGGSGGVAYDVFATAALSPTESSHRWAWLGQGLTCNIYSMTNLPPFSAYLILGTPLDSDFDGVTSAYERLVLGSDPDNPDSSGDGMLDGWKAYWGLDALVNNPAQAHLRRNYDYDGGGWLREVTGVQSSSVTLDNEGNVQGLP